MRVAVDARHLAGGRGVAHYTSELLAALAERFPADEWRAFVPGGGAVTGPSGAPAASGAGVRIVRHRLPSRVLFGSSALLGRPRIDALVGGADVVWVPAPAPVAVSRGVPYVLTVHDLSWLERPEDFTPYERLWHRLGRLERLAVRARVVVAVSEATREAIAERWPAVRDVRVVQSGIPSLPPARRPVRGLPERYVLCVGALEPRKAPERLADAFAQARADGLDAELVFAGDGRLAGTLRRPGVHVIERPDRATLAALYEDALALALPSQLEGFGFTALEAARAGVPVLAGERLTVVGETLGDAVLRVADGGWAQALGRIAADGELRGRLAAAAGARAAGFTWAGTAEQMRAILEEASR